MHIHLNIEADTTEEILAAIKELSATGVTPIQKPAEGKKSSHSNKAATSKATEPATDTTLPAETEKTEEETIPTVNELKEAAVAKGKTPEGKKAIKDLLASFESPSISAIPEDKRAAFLAALKDL
ncbi:hypothetical protein SOV_04460 [Sporomusa ovata DSM 2662]|uniref:Uncharacterized protein n=1 Tax=Sporomusa ovata TaxID=2378 RepID=A0A0U1KXJ2_9FIRM|nr:hypothetical protein [Sporomusa ovata]EQB28116.1 hypothetical protein SOV_2c10390 [Sporomusa ovata DSM 2662]CQR71653.1 hypothetical protein SpAn4DRAFT_3519 [Sporomusa ovata]